MTLYAVSMYMPVPSMHLDDVIQTQGEFVCQLNVRKQINFFFKKYTTN